MKALFTIPASGIVVALMLASCSQKAENKNELNSTDSIPVKIQTVQSGETSADINTTGLVATENNANYAFKIGGVISRIFVQEGQFFKKGQLLASLNNTEINAQLEQAKLNVEKAKRDYTRASNLYKDSVATLEQLQNAKTGLDVAQKAEDAVAFNAQYSKIYASNDGFVTKKIASEGEVAGQGTPVLAINETNGNSNYTLKVGVSSIEWAAIRINQKALITLDGFPGQTFQGIVFRKSQAADQADGSFQVEIKIDLENAKPAIGMFGKAQILADQSVSSRLIPYDALIEADGNKAYVFALVNGNHVMKAPIVIESFNNKEVYVKSGLENISQIVVSNSAFLNEQSSIKIIK